jgi:probable phosphoglycerate mutase
MTVVFHNSRLGVFVESKECSANSLRVEDVDLSRKIGRIGYSTAAIEVVIDVLYASDLSRAQETAAPIARDHGLAICTEPALRELYFGSLEGVDVPVLERENPDFVWAWNNDFCNLRCPDGESVVELYARMEAVCARIARENAGKTVCCVTHGAALRALRCVWEGKGVAQINRLGWASNASVSVVTYEDGTYTVQVYGDDAHIADIRTQVGDRAPGECK